MSVQFGRWNLDGRAVDEPYLHRVKALLSPYGADGGTDFADLGVVILSYAFHTTTESRQEVQPYTMRSGDILTWDGRLDNRSELIGALGDSFDARSTDLEIVAAAYEQWGTHCFRRLIGDWALAIWSSRTHRLILAKDFAG